jgi:hypothetical protein
MCHSALVSAFPPFHALPYAFSSDIHGYRDGISVIPRNASMFLAAQSVSPNGSRLRPDLRWSHHLIFSSSGQSNYLFYL